MKYKITQKEFVQNYKQVRHATTIMEATLLAQIYIENRIDKFLDDNLDSPRYLWKGSYLRYENKLRFALALGLIGDEKSWDDFIPGFKIMGKLRNNYAHKFNYVLTDKDIEFLDWANSFFINKEKTREKVGDLEYVKRAFANLMTMASVFADKKK